MEVSGIAHIFLTASNFERTRRILLQAAAVSWADLGLKSVIDTDAVYYCVGGRTAVAIRAPAAEHAGAAFQQNRVGLHHLCFRARERADVDESHGLLCSLGVTIIRAPRGNSVGAGILFAAVRRSRRHQVGSSTMFRERGCWAERRCKFERLALRQGSFRFAENAQGSKSAVRDRAADCACRCGSLTA
jgi:catechol 2,3-dioxygenase-like lactoylglutathione lyase family enzyme